MQTRHARTSRQETKTHLLFALANRNAKAGVNPTPALIETTANPKRCGFPMSRKKSGPSDQFAGTN